MPVEGAPFAGQTAPSLLSAELRGSGELGGIAQDFRAQSTRAWWAVLALAFLLILSINPSGFIGGGQDDWHYLQAARCLREHGLCLPHDHWEARWPVTAPIALVTAVLGESRVAVSIAPGIASLVAIFLMALIGNRLFGRPVGWLSALLLLITPAFSMQLTQPSVESTELVFIFAGFLCVLHWQEKQRPVFAVLAGLLFAMAVQVRETAIFAGLFAGFLWVRGPKPRLSDLAAAAAGFAVPFLVEFAWFAASTGDPLYRRKLSMAHTQLWSSELLGPIDRQHWPFFNTANIAHWRMEPGLHVHWAIDGLLNLFINALAGLSLPIVALALIFGRRKLGPLWSRRTLAILLIAVAYMACLIYVLAIDPKPRMMLVPLSLTNMALALVTLRLREIGYPLLAGALWLASAIVGLSLQFAHQRTYYIEAASRRWIQQIPGQVEIEFTTRKYLALVPSAQRLPGISADQQFLLFASSVPCTEWVQKSGLGTGTLSVIATQKNTAIQLPSIGGELCLLRYNRRVPSKLMAATIQRLRVERLTRTGRGHFPLAKPSANGGDASNSVVH